MIEIVVVAALALVILGFGALVYWMKRQTDALKSAVAVQENTIVEQADHMKAQGEVLKNVEEVHRLMKAMLDIVDAPAMVKRWEDYRALVDHEREQLARVQPQEVNEVRGYPETVLAKRAALLDSWRISHPPRSARTCWKTASRGSRIPRI